MKKALWSTWLAFKSMPSTPHRRIFFLTPTYIYPEYHSLGVMLAKSPCQNTIRVYNPERTLCDILKTRSNTDIQIITDAFKQYVHNPQKNIPLLSHYSRMFHVEKRVRYYLDCCFETYNATMKCSLNEAKTNNTQSG